MAICGGLPYAHSALQLSSSQSSCSQKDKTIVFDVDFVFVFDVDFVHTITDTMSMTSSSGGARGAGTPQPGTPHPPG